MRNLLGTLVMIGFATQACAVDINQTFSPTLLQPTQISSVRIDFVNNDTSVVSDMGLSSTLVNDVFLATPANFTSSCGGVLSGSNSSTSGSFTLTGASVPERVGSSAGTCFISFDAYAATAGTFVNTIPAGTLTGTRNGTSVTNDQQSQATLATTIQDLTGNMRIAIGSNVIQGAETTQRIITLTNPNDVAVTGVTFDHNLENDDGYNLRASGSVAGTCGGTNSITGTPSSSGSFGNTSIISISGASVAANSSCTLIYDVMPSRDATLPFFDATFGHNIPAGRFSTDQGASNTNFSHSIRTLTGIAVEKFFDGSTSAQLNTNTASGADLSLVITNYNGSEIPSFDLTDLLPAGLNATNIFRNTCGGASSTGAGDEVTVTGAAINGASSSPIAGAQTAVCNIDARIEPTTTTNQTYNNTIPAGNLGGYAYDATSASLEVTDVIAPENPLTVVKNFQRSNIYPGEYQHMTLTFTNTYDEVITNIDLLDDLVADMTSGAAIRVGAAGVFSNGCNGTVTAVPNTTTVQVNDVSLQVGESCDVRVQITQASDASDNRTITNTIPTNQITFDLVDQTGRQILNAPSDSLFVRRPVDLFKSYSPDTVPAGGETRLRLTFTRRSRIGATTNSIAFVDNLPANHFVAPAPNVLNECGGTVTANPGGNSIQLSGGSLGPVPSETLSCSVEVNIVAPNSIGGTTNTVLAGDTTALDGGQPSGLNTLTTTRNRSDRLDRTQSTLTVTKAFMPNTIKAAEKSRVRITIANTQTGAIDLTGIGVLDDFAGTELAISDDVAPTFTDTSGTPNANGCRSGTFVAAAGAGGSISLADAEIDGGSTCYFEFNATSFSGGNIPNNIPANAVVSDQGTTNPSAVAATLTVERAFNISKGFSPSTVTAGQPSTLTISIRNDTLTQIDGSTNPSIPTLVDVLPTGLTVVANSVATNCLDGTVSLSAGSDEIRLDGAAIPVKFPSESDCQITASVVGASTGRYNNLIPASTMNTSNGSSNARSADAPLAILAKPSIAKAFSPTAIAAGEISQITFTLTNSNDAATLPAGMTGAAFSDALTDMIIASPPGVGGTCDGLSYSASAGGTAFSATDIQLLPAASCTVTLNVTSTVSGTLPNTSSGVTTDQTPAAGDPSNTANLTGSGSVPVTMTKTFVDDEVKTNTASTILFELTNTNAFDVAIGNPGFTDTFPTSPGAMVIADAPNVFTTCSGAVEDGSGGALAAGDADLRLDGGFVPANGTCYVSVDVKMSAQGSYSNTTSALTTAAGTSSAASDTIVVTDTLAIASAQEANRNVRASDNDFFVDSVLGTGDTIAGEKAIVGPGTDGNVDLTVVSTSGPQISVDPDTGIIAIAGGTPPGSYSVTYQICQAGDPSNCAANRTETVIVADANINAAATYTAGSPLVVMQNDFNQEPGNVIGSGDELDGIHASVAPGTGGNVDLTIGTVTGPDPSAITVNLNTGFITVGSGAAAGTYMIPYQICEDDNATNCASATETIEVRVTPIAAAADAQRNLTGSDDPISAGNVIGTGDTLDGGAATVGAGPGGNVDLQVTSVTLDGSPTTLVAVNLDTGEMVVAPGAPDGTYAVTYEIREESNRGNCVSATETIVVTSNTVAAAAEVTRDATGSDGTIAAGNVLSAANDQIAGSVATVGTGGNAILSVVSGVDTDAELTLNTATGALSVTPGTAAGTYTLRYRLCEASNTDNCAEAVETVTVTDTSIAAAVEADRPLRQANADQTAGSVIGSSDQINSVQATPGFGGNVILREVSADPDLSLDPETGIITVAGDTAAGSPTITYRICEPANQDNCATATETVVITRTPIATAAEANRPVSQRNDSQTAGSVLGTGDTLDSAPATAGTSGNVTLTRTGGDAQLTLNAATGDIVVAGDTPVGTYTITYRMCEATNSFNCSSSTETVEVSRKPIMAAAEGDRNLTGADDAQSAGNVIGLGDTIDGAQAAIGSNVTVAVVTGANTDAALLLNTSTGEITAAAGTAAGTYTLEYRICESVNSNNCATAIETVIITDTSIDAIAEVTRTVAQNNSGVGAGNVFGAGDLIGGSGAVAGSDGNVILSLVTADTPLSLDTATGAITVAANTAVGSYTIEYRICEPSNTDNCDAATETVEVTLNTIQAVSETPFAVVGNNTSQPAGNAIGPNDLLDGTQVTVGAGGTAILTVVTGAETDAELSLNTDTGEITVAAGTIAGAYTLRYRICEATNTGNCAEAVETVNVSDTTITAGAEDDRPLTGSDMAQSAGNVLDAANDQLDGAATVPGPGGNVVLSTVAGPFTSPGLTLDGATGALTVAAGQAAGTYALRYQICEAANTDNCVQATERVIVTDTNIVAAAEANRELRSLDAGQTAGNVLSFVNDIADGVAADPATGGNVVLTAMTGPSTSLELSLETATGGLSVTPDTPPGTYTLQYQICEVGNSDNCATATETVVITLTPLMASAEPDRDLQSRDAAQSAGNVLGATNDVLNGVAATPGVGGSVVLSTVVGPNTAPELSIDLATGALTVAADTRPGSYTIEYQLCEAANLDNCITAVETVNIVLTPIIAGAEPHRALFSTDAAQTAGHVLDALNDTLDSVAAIPGIGGSVVLAQIPGGSPELSLNPATGEVTIAPDTGAGIYTIHYEICEALNLDNCARAIEAVVVSVTPISAVGIDHGEFDIAGGGDTASVLGDDLLGGLMPTAGSVASVVINLPSGMPDPGITMDPATGVLSVAIGTPPGPYAITYQICEATNLDNCTTAIETLTVVAIAAFAENFPVVTSNGGTTTSILASDAVGGVAATLSAVTMSVVDADPGLALDTANGLLTLVPDLAAGAYSLTYQICSVAFPTSCEQATETVVQGARSSVEARVISTVTDNGDGVDGVGDIIRYTITVANTGNTPLAELVLTETFTDLHGNPLNLTSGPDFQSATIGSDVTNIGMGGSVTYIASFTLDVPTVTSGGVSLSFDAAVLPVHGPDVPGVAELVSDTSDSGHSDDGNSEDDPTMILFATSQAAHGLTIKKTTPSGDVDRGMVVSYTITVENALNVVAGTLDVVDTLPVGFQYQPNSARLNGVSVTPEVAGRRVVVPDVTVPPLTTITLTLQARITTGVQFGEHVNSANVFHPVTGAPLADSDTAVVRISPEPVFDCGDVIGKVFDDANRDGYQNQGEIGIAAVRLATVDGTVITTDQYGRYHVPCAALPADRGSNFILKLDTRSLPTGYRLTTENPRAVRLTRGKMFELNFGAAVTRIVRIDLNAAAFTGGVLSDRLHDGINRLVAHIAADPSEIRLSYTLSRQAADQERAVARRALNSVEAALREVWRGQGRYRLIIEKTYLMPN